MSLKRIMWENGRETVMFWEPDTLPEGATSAVEVAIVPLEMAEEMAKRAEMLAEQADTLQKFSLKVTQMYKVMQDREPKQEVVRYLQDLCLKEGPGNLRSEAIIWLDEFYIEDANDE